LTATASVRLGLSRFRYATLRFATQPGGLRIETTNATRNINFNTENYRTATFSATAAGTGYVSFDWTYTFHHAWYDVEADFYVFADDSSGTTSIHEVDFYNLNYTGERTFSGSSTILVEEGYEFGFII